MDHTMSAPQRTGFLGAIKLFFTHYVDFRGTSRRSEYWWMFLTNTVILLGLFFWMAGGFVTQLIQIVNNPHAGTSFMFTTFVPAILLAVYSVVILVPSIALAARRFRDAGVAPVWLILTLGGPVAIGAADRFQHVIWIVLFSILLVANLAIAVLPSRAPATVPVAPTVPYVRFGDAVKNFFKNAFHFSGRSTRSEYWWIMLIVFTVEMVLDGFTTRIIFANAASLPRQTSLIVAWRTLWRLAPVSYGLLVGFSLLTLIPVLALTVRRFRDAGVPGWLGAVAYILPLFISWGQSATQNLAFTAVSFLLAVTTVVVAATPSKLLAS